MDYQEFPSEPSISTWTSEAFSEWGSRVSGMLSVPLTVAALVASLYPGQHWWSSTVAAACWVLSATIAWGWTGYSMWAKERRRVISLHGRPVVVPELLPINSESDPHWLIGVRSTTDDVAINVMLDPVKISDYVTLEFDPIPSLATIGPHLVQVSRHGHGYAWEGVMVDFQNL